jgi:hypothetical protein
MGHMFWLLQNGFAIYSTPPRMALEQIWDDANFWSVELWMG